MLVPWRNVRVWRCTRCGKCCWEFRATLNIGEAIYLSRKYGDVIKLSNGKYVIRKVNGRCVFLTYSTEGLASCTIHLEKPRSCRMYPFYVYTSPKFGLAGDDALFKLNDEKFYVYLDDFCKNLNRTGFDVETLLPRVVRYWKRQSPVLSFEEEATFSPSLHAPIVSF